MSGEGRHGDVALMVAGVLIGLAGSILASAFLHGHAAVLVAILILVVGIGLALCGLVGFRRRRPGHPDKRGVNAAHLDLYAGILTEGEAILTALEGAVERSRPPWTTTPKESFDISGFTLAYIQNGQGWMARSQDEISKRVGKPTAASSRRTRSPGPSRDTSRTNRNLESGERWLVGSTGSRLRSRKDPSDSLL